MRSVHDAGYSENLHAVHTDCETKGFKIRRTLRCIRYRCACLGCRRTLASWTRRTRAHGGWQASYFDTITGWRLRQSAASPMASRCFSTEALYPS